MNTYNVAILFAINGSNKRMFVEDWNVGDLLRQIDDVSAYYGFQFEQREKTITTTGFSRNIDIKTIKTSGVYYVNCYVETFEDLMVQPKKNELLLKQMTHKNIDRVVRIIGVKNDIILPFNEEDCLIDNEGNVIE